MSCGGYTCDDLSVPDYKIPIEARLVRYLKAWRDDQSSHSANGGPVEQEIRSLLEWYICECLKYGPSNLKGWWSDGVIRLEILLTANDCFKLLGVTWIDSQGVAPFEIDAELDPKDDSKFARTIFRIGTLDEHNQPMVFDRRIDAGHILQTRPVENPDWAMAVELTPPEPGD